MIALREALADYLALRRSLGYTLQRSEKLLGQFLDYLEAEDTETVTTENALAWARKAKSHNGNWWSLRLSASQRTFKVSRLPPRYQPLIYCPGNPSERVHTFTQRRTSQR